jgi:hypothetical protein
MFLIRGKKGMNFLTENVVYVIIVLIFFSFLFVFVIKQGSDTAFIEQKTAKRIALAIDAANPGTQIIINLGDVLEEKEDGIEEVIRIGEGYVNVRLSEKSKDGFYYGFFNRAKVDFELKDENLILKIVEVEKKSSEENAGVGGGENE